MPVDDVASSICQAMPRGEDDVEPRAAEGVEEPVESRAVAVAGEMKT